MEPNEQLGPAPAVAVTGERPVLERLFAGSEFDSARVSLLATGRYTHQKGELRVQTQQLPNGEHEILAIATVARDPGPTNTYIQSVQDFQNASKNQQTLVKLLWQVYRNEGLVNNAVNKIASILSATCTFKVRRAAKGKVRNAKSLLEEALVQWQRRVNTAASNAMATGTRGHASLNFQLVRYALIEGSWFGRGVWTVRTLPGLKGEWSMPWTIQTITTEQLEVDTLYQGTGIDRIYWKPPTKLLGLVRSTDPRQQEEAQKFISPEMFTKLKKDSKVELDPALLLHCKHRGKETDEFGDSMIQPALPSLAYLLALHQLDIVCMQNLINRLTIVMVGSADPKSPYSRPEVAAARQALMQQFFTDPGPNMTLVWAGNDVEVKDIGAYDSVLDLGSRFDYARQSLKEALGVPEAILTGRAPDGAAADWAATIGASANLSELANNVANMWTTLGERIAIENGFTDVDVICEFDASIMADRTKERTQNRSDYITGLRSIRSTLLGAGLDPDAEYLQMCREKGLPEDARWVDAFAPPQGLQGQGAVKDPGRGRTPNDERPDGGEPA